MEKNTDGSTPCMRNTAVFRIDETQGGLRKRVGGGGRKMPKWRTDDTPRHRIAVPKDPRCPRPGTWTQTLYPGPRTSPLKVSLRVQLVWLVWLERAGQPQAWTMRVVEQCSMWWGFELGNFVNTRVIVGVGGDGNVFYVMINFNWLAVVKLI